MIRFVFSSPATELIIGAGEGQCIKGYGRRVGHVSGVECKWN